MQDENHTQLHPSRYRRWRFGSLPSIWSPPRAAAPWVPSARLHLICSLCGRLRVIAARRDPRKHDGSLRRVDYTRDRRPTQHSPALLRAPNRLVALSLAPKRYSMSNFVLSAPASANSLQSPSFPGLRTRQHTDHRQARSAFKIVPRRLRPGRRLLRRRALSSAVSLRGHCRSLAKAMRLIAATCKHNNKPHYGNLRRRVYQ